MEWRHVSGKDWQRNLVGLLWALEDAPRNGLPSRAFQISPLLFRCHRSNRLVELGSDLCSVHCKLSRR